jgi:hypothetical protein
MKLLILGFLVLTTFQAVANTDVRPVLEASASMRFDCTRKPTRFSVYNNKVQNLSSLTIKVGGENGRFELKGNFEVKDTGSVFAIYKTSERIKIGTLAIKHTDHAACANYDPELELRSLDVTVNLDSEVNISLSEIDLEDSCEAEEAMIVSTAYLSTPSHDKIKIGNAKKYNSSDRKSVCKSLGIDL